MPVARAADVLVAGASVRGLAQSASRAGFRVAAIDAYGDLDLLACAHTVALRRDLGVGYTADAAASAARTIAAAAVAYASNFENHPAAVERLAAGRTLLGNPPAVLAEVRNPVALARALARRGFAVPAVRASVPRHAGGRQWLRKPRNSGGGHGIARWRPGGPLPKGTYLQERIAGIPGSIVFVADGRRAVPLGLSRQLVGDRTFGAQGFRYCGNILAGGRPELFEAEAQVADTAARLAQAVTEMFGLVGVNGIDFVARGGVPYPIEVNPRYSASMELVERAHGVCIFALHAAACRGALEDPGTYMRTQSVLVGKAIVYARSEVIMGQTRRWLPGESVRDIPHPGESFAAGQPICTVLARGATLRTCRTALARRAARVYAAARMARAERSVA
ncbi:MAG TPA: ATP-grasp domain-containing protein [Gemmatimonadales bacterium]|nr:ATP-grasp domain-containing protein [Gemmatimonadales bacterium]